MLNIKWNVKIIKYIVLLFFLILLNSCVLNNKGKYFNNIGMAPFLHEMVNNLYLEEGVLSYNLFSLRLVTYYHSVNYDDTSFKNMSPWIRVASDEDSYDRYSDSDDNYRYVFYVYTDKHQKKRKAIDHKVVAVLDRIYNAEDKVFIKNYLTKPDIFMYIGSKKYKSNVLDFIQQKIIKERKAFTLEIFSEKIASRQEAKNGYELYLNDIGNYKPLNNAINLAYSQFYEIAERLTLLHNDRKKLTNKYDSISDIIGDIDRDIRSLSAAGYELAQATKKFFKLAKREMSRLEVASIRTNALKGLKTFSSNIDETKSKQYQSIEEAAQATIKALEKFESTVNQ